MTFLKKLPFVFVMVGMWACAPVQKANERETYNMAGIENAGLFQPSGEFAQVVSRIEPVAEAFCRDSGRPLNCDFEVITDARDPENVNAFQTLRKNGRPLIVFTQALIDTTQNDDELAFVLGHEMAHHLEGHLHRQYQSARAGAILLGGITAITGLRRILLSQRNASEQALARGPIPKSLNWRQTGSERLSQFARVIMPSGALHFLPVCLIPEISFSDPILRMKRALKWYGA